MIYWCNICNRFVYSHDMKIDGICPFCGTDNLQITDEDEQQFDVKINCENYDGGEALDIYR